MKTKYSADAYTLILIDSIKRKNYDIFYYMLSVKSPLYEEEYADSATVELIMKYVNDDNHLRILELLYTYYKLTKDSDDVIEFNLISPVWEHKPKKLKYVILFISNLWGVSVKAVLDYYLKKFDDELREPYYDDSPLKFYNSFLEAGVPLSYFKEIQSVNETIPIWLSTIKEDI